MSDAWSIDQVIESIEKLYASNDSKQIKTLQDQLQVIQKSTDGYKLAQLLLQQQTRSCRYFGALTFTVFINTHLGPKSTISQQQLQQVFSKLLDHVLELSNVADGVVFERNLYVIKKLLSNVSLLYAFHFKECANPIEQMISKFDQLSLSFDDERKSSLLLFMNSILVEDLSTRDESSQDLHQVIYDSVFARYNSLLKDLFFKSPSKQIQSIIIDSINSWVIYISNAESTSKQRYTSADMQLLIQVLLSQLQITSMIEENDFDLYNKNFTVLTETIETNPRLLSDAKPLIYSILFDEEQFGYFFIKNYILDKDKYEEHIPEVESFCNLIISFLNMIIVHLSRNILDESVFRIMEIALNLSALPGNPTVDESISELFLGFWEELVNIYIDDSSVVKDLMKENYDIFLARRNNLLMRISNTYWSKCKYFSGASSEFAHYRLQISDLFNFLYTLLNTELYSDLCQAVVTNLTRSQTADTVLNIEASLYLLYKITDDLTFYDDDTTQHLVPFIENLFRNNLIEVFERIDSTNRQIQMTLLNLLSSVPFFFKDSIGNQYLSSTFNFLFSIILNRDVDSKNISLIASKTVLKICQDSKQNLIGFLPNINSILIEMIKNMDVDNLIRERLVNSYISIAQSMKDPVRLGQIILTLLQHIDDTSLKAMSNIDALLSQGLAPEDLEDYLVSLLSCVNEVGKAAQLPEDLEDYLTSEETTLTNNYWNEDPLSIKPMIISILNRFALTFSPLVNNSLVTEKCCNILKSGLSEPINGPFKFEITVIFDFLIVKFNSCNIPSISFIYKLLETVVITNTKTVTAEVLDQLISSLFLSKLSTFLEDVDSMKSSIEFFSTVLEKAPRLLIYLPVFEREILKFSLWSLDFHETFLVKSITKFWNHVITLKKGNGADHVKMQFLMNQLQLEEQPLNFCLEQKLLGAFLSSPRSNMDYYYPVFRGFIVKYPLLFKRNLKILFDSPNFNSKLSVSSVDQFINKLMLTRGQRQANEVLKKFWLEQNGLIEYGI